MREYIIADNQDISKAGMMFLLSRQKDVSVLLEADNKAELIQQLRLYPQEYPQRNCTGEDDKRNSGRKEPQLSYNQQPPKEYLPEAGSQQCARSYQVRDACRDCGFSGILYLTAGSVLKGNSLSGYLTTSYTYPRFFIINHPELTGSNALQLLRR